MICNIINLIYELSLELPNDHRKLGILEKSQIWVETQPSAQTPETKPRQYQPKSTQKWISNAPFTAQFYWTPLPTQPSPAPRPATQTRRPAQPGPHMNHNNGLKWLNSIPEFLSKNFKMSANCNNFNTSFNRQIRVGYLDCLTRLEHTKRVAQHHGSAHKVR